MRTFIEMRGPIILAGALLASTSAFALPPQVQLPALSPTGDASATTAIATLAANSATMAARFKTMLNVMVDFNAKCDGTTDDTTVLRAALTAAGGVSRLLFPAGVTCLTKQLTVPANSWVTINGTLKVITGANASGTAYALYTAANSNILIDGIGTIDGNASGQTAANPNYSSAVVTNGGSNITLRDFTIINTKNWPFSFNHGSHHLVDHVSVITGGNSPQFSFADDCWASTINVTGINDESFAFYGGDTNCGIISSKLTNGAADGIAVLHDSGSNAPSQHVHIIHNNVSGMQGAGASVVTGTGGTGQSSDISILGNDFHGNGANASGRGGIFVSNGLHLTLGANQISNDLGTNGNQSIGIWLQSTAFARIDTNTITDEGQTTGAIGTAVHLDSSDSNIQMGPNSFIDDQTTHTMTFGINGSGANHMVVLDQTMIGIATPYPSTFPSDTVFRPLVPITTTIPSGSSYSTVANVTRVALSSGVSSPFTFTLPAVPLDGEVLTLSCDATLTLTVNPNSGQTLIGSPTSCSALQGHQWQYTLSTTTWRLNY